MTERGVAAAGAGAQPRKKRSGSIALDVGVFLVSAGVLLFELLPTRIFSVTMYYHLSFMVVSLAMLGPR